MQYLTRRGLLIGLSAALAGCKLYSDEVPPVPIGGALVSPDASIMKALRASANHTRLVAALEEAGLAELLEENEPLTLFAPTDEAFAKLELAAQSGVGSLPEMQQILLNNIVPARLNKEELASAFREMTGATKVLALNDQVVRILAAKKGAIQIGDMGERVVNVLSGDAIASNGIIYVTDGVLLPKVKVPDAPDQ